jgi:hypothetical protein
MNGAAAKEKQDAADKEESCGSVQGEHTLYQG